MTGCLPGGGAADAAGLLSPKACSGVRRLAVPPQRTLITSVPPHPPSSALLLTRAINQQSSRAAHNARHFPNNSRMGERNREREPAHHHRSGDPVPAIEPRAVVVRREVVCARAARADGVGQRRQHVEKRDEQGQPVPEERAGEDDEQEAEREGDGEEDDGWERISGCAG